MVYGHPSTDIHTNVYANTVNTRDRGPECTAALPERIRHAGGTVGDRGAWPGRIPAAARAHNPVRGLQQLRGPTGVPARARAVCVDERAGGRTAGGGASGRGGDPTGAGGRAAAAGAGPDDATGTCAHL